MRDFFGKIFSFVEHYTRIIIEPLPVILIAALIYWLVRRAWHKRKLGGNFKQARKKALLNETIRFLLVCWIAGIVTFVLMPYDFWGKVWYWIIYGEWYPYPDDILPGRQIIPSLFLILIGHFRVSADFIVEQIVNVVLFVPLGIALPFVWKRANFPRTLLVGFLLTLLIELVQPFLFRTGDIDDVITNTLGTILGYLLYLLMKKLLPRFTAKCKCSVYDAAREQLSREN